jgi:hypothetical protein
MVAESRVDARVVRVRHGVRREVLTLGHTITE